MEQFSLTWNVLTCARIAVRGPLSKDSMFEQFVSCQHIAHGYTIGIKPTTFGSQGNTLTSPLTQLHAQRNTRPQQKYSRTSQYFRQARWLRQKFHRTNPFWLPVFWTTFSGNCLMFCTNVSRIAYCFAILCLLGINIASTAVHRPCEEQYCGS